VIPDLLLCPAPFVEVATAVRRVLTRLCESRAISGEQRVSFFARERERRAVHPGYRAGLTERREDGAYGGADLDERSGLQEQVRNHEPAERSSCARTKSSAERSVLPAISNSALHEADRGGRTEVRRIR